MINLRLHNDLKSSRNESRHRFSTLLPGLMIAGLLTSTAVMGGIKSCVCSCCKEDPKPT